MPDLIVGYTINSELERIQQILARFVTFADSLRRPFGAVLAEFAETFGVRVPTVLPILREALIPGVPSEVAERLREEIPTLRYIVESRPVSFDETYGPEPLPTQGAELEWGLEQIGVGQTTRSGEGVRVGVVDTGLAVNHPDFRGRPNTFFMNERSQTDAHGHGTFVTGIIAGPRAPAKPPRYGVAPGVTLFIANVTNDQGGDPTETEFSLGVEWALSMGCQLINLSWQKKFDPTRPVSFLEAKGEEALRRGCRLIAAGGNLSDRPGTISPVSEPGHARSVLAIGSVDKGTLKVSDFSPRSDGIPGGEVNFAAPGDQIRSALRPLPGPVGELYKVSSATSWSAAMVTGLAALYIESGVPVQELPEKLASRARPLNEDPRDVGFGLPLVP